MFHGKRPRMASKKLAEVVRKLNLHALREIDVWRKGQDPIPNVSELIRRLVEIGIEALAHGYKPKKIEPDGDKPKPKEK